MILARRYGPVLLTTLIRRILLHLAILGEMAMFGLKNTNKSERNKALISMPINIETNVLFKTFEYNIIFKSISYG